MTTEELATNLEPSEREVKGRGALDELVPGTPGLIDGSVGDFSPATARRIYENPRWIHKDALRPSGPLRDRPGSTSRWETK